MAEIRIEPTSEIITDKPRLGRPPVYPWEALEKVGMSFWIPDTAKTYTAVYMAVNRQNKKGEAQFVVTKGDKDGILGWRVQRVN